MHSYFKLKYETLAFVESITNFNFGNVKLVSAIEVAKNIFPFYKAYFYYLDDKPAYNA